MHMLRFVHGNTEYESETIHSCGIINALLLCNHTLVF